ncbi:uncharacterized protein LOC130945560 [Arachis stenosperma]|uniref:uncharacterized protein LOC130945560 n=1 Tax=Arachis stenosperma TaxID=217475 RepID=UPI0025ABBB5A|nr:uncharacterized protein LOC130945560 [Arachis stenosperma]
MVTGKNQDLEDDPLSAEEDVMDSEDEIVPETEKIDEGMEESNRENSKSEITVENMGQGLYNIVINEEAKKELWKPWWRSLIVKIMGRKVGYVTMKRRIENMWGRLGELDVIDLGNDYYLVKFYAQEDLDAALVDGPWKIYDHYLTVRLWEPNFNLFTTTIDKITAWIRLPGLPIELYNEKILRKIGDLIERTCKIDYNTSHLCRGKFVRLCVEIDLTKPLLGRYMVNENVYQVEYDGIHQICFTCSKADHEQKHCAIWREKMRKTMRNKLRILKLEDNNNKELQQE